MTSKQLIYAASNTLSRKRLEALLSDGMEVRVEVADDIERYYLDTFDWRLFRSGMVLEAEVRGGVCLLTWREMGSGQVLLSRTVKKLPKLAADFSNAGMQPRLKQILGTRLLLAHASLQGCTERLLLLDRDEKTIMRVELRHDKCISPDNPAYMRLPDALYFFPYRGYEKVFNNRLRQISRHGGLLHLVDDPLVLALDALDITPGKYSGIPQFSLHPGQPSIHALSDILLRFLQIMETNIKGARESEDPEFLHDFLVAVRRIRCFLFTFAALFPGDKVKLFESDLQWVEQEATIIRDLDIYMGLLQDFESRVDKDHRQALNSLYSFLQSEKQEQLMPMQVALASPRYLRLTDSLHSYLHSCRGADELPDAISIPIEVAASNGIHSIYSELLQAGRGLSVTAKVEKIHALYQICKRLGYHMEIFSSLFPGKHMRRLQQAHGKLQQRLNHFRDVDLQCHRLKDYLSRMTRTQAMREISLEAMEQLIDDRKRERKKALSRAMTQIELFTRKKMRKRFRAVFALPAKGGGV